MADHANKRCRARYIVPLRNRLAILPAAAEVVLRDFAAQSIAMNAQRFGGAALIAAGMFQDAANEFLLKFGHGLVEQNATIDHHADQRIQFLFHVCVLRKLSRVRGR